MAGYVDLDTILNPATGTNATTAWGDGIRSNFENSEVTIARTVLSGAASSISSGTLTTLSNAWALKIYYRAQHATTSVNVLLRFNGDSGSNYTRSYILGLDTAVSGDSEATTTALTWGTADNTSANRWSTGQMFIPDYLGSGHKTGMAQVINPANMTAMALAVYGMVWASTAAITSVSITASSGNFVTGSSLTVVACNYV
jgi:hypothetical protein